MAHIRENGSLGQGSGSKRGETWKRAETFLEAEIAGLGGGLYVGVIVSEAPRRTAMLGVCTVAGWWEWEMLEQEQI